MKILFFIYTVVLFACASSDTLVNGIFNIKINMVFKTVDRNSAEKMLCSKIDSMGGWLLNASQQEIRFRLPGDSVSRFLELVDSLGITADKNYSRSDVTNEYLRLIASLQAKESLLKQYLVLLDSSGTEGIYPVFREITDLQSSIESIKGQMRGMVERMNYAEIKIYFNFNVRRAPIVSGDSEFEWLNTVNLPGLLEDFR